MNKFLTSMLPLDSQTYTGSSCIISINEYGQYILADADASFFKKCGITPSCIGAPVSAVFSAAFNSYLKEMYNRYDSSELLVMPRYDHYGLPAAYPETGLLNIDIALYIKEGKPEFKCTISGSHGISYNRHFEGFTFCVLSNGNIVMASPEFYQFMENYNLDTTFITSLQIVENVMKTAIPEKKLITLTDFSGTSHPHFFTVIPNENVQNSSVIIYIHKVGNSDRLIKLNTLTSREDQIIRLAAKGLTNRSIASELGISEGCVKKTLSNAYSKLGIETRMEIYKLF